MSSPEPLQPQASKPGSAAGCWAAALIALGILIALVSGLCVGGSLVGGFIDVLNGDATVLESLGPILPFLLVSLPFLAGGIALIVWGVRIQRRK
jgi:uncharacterized RDD family membrane protein YckC